jgi:membrane associated rhomboid family serine protease
MSTTDRPNLLLRINRSRWTVPAFAVVFGVTVLAIQAANGDPAGGVVSLGIMLVYAGILVVTSRHSETVSLLRGEVPDERAELIQLRAAAMTCYVLVTVLVAGFVVSLARGSDQVSVWANLSALTGLTYLASLLWVRRRS